MSTPVPWLDRFVKWFFNCSTTACLDTLPKDRATIPVKPTVRASPGAAGSSTRSHATGRKLTPFNVGSRGLR